MEKVLDRRVFILPVLLSPIEREHLRVQQERAPTEFCRIKGPALFSPRWYCAFHDVYYDDEHPPIEELEKQGELEDHQLPWWLRY
jgi:hypothetical protein